MHIYLTKFEASPEKSWIDMKIKPQKIQNENNNNIFEDKKR